MATWLQTLSCWHCRQDKITVVEDGKTWLFQLNLSCVIRHWKKDVVVGVMGHFHSSKRLAFVHVQMQSFQRDDVNSSYHSRVDSFIFCCGFCLLCQSPILLPHEYFFFFHFPFIYPSICLTLSAGVSGLSVWSARGAFIECRSHTLSEARLRLMSVLCPQASPIIFMTLIKCAVNIKALKWWR